MEPLPRGRPRSFNTDTALDTLLALFRRRGYEATSLLEMVEATGLNKSSLRAAFGSKQEIYRAVQEHYRRVFVTPLLAPIRDGTRGLEDLHLLFSAQDEVLQSATGADGCMATNTAMERGASDPIAAGFHAAFRQEVRMVVAAAMRRAIEAGEIGPEGCESRGEVLVALFFGALVSARVGPVPGEHQRRLEGIRTLLEAWRLVPS